MIAAPRPGYRWFVLAIACLNSAAFSAYSMGMAAIGPILRDRYSISLVETGVLLTGVTVGQLFTTAAWGMLTDRYPERLVLFLGVGSAAVCVGAAAFAPSYQFLLVCMALSGATGSCSVSAASRLILAWFGRDERGLAIGVRLMSVPAAAAVAAAVLPALALTRGYTTAVLALAGFTGIAAVTSGIWIRMPREHATAASSRPRFNPLRDPRAWRLAVAGNLLTVGQSALVTYAVLFLNQRRGLSVPAAAAVLGALQVGAAGSRVALGWLSDRRGLRVGLLRSVGLAGTLAFALLAVVVAAPLTVLVPVLVIAGVVSLSSTGLGTTAMGELAGGGQVATAVGMYNTFFAAAGVAGPILFGSLVTATGWPEGFAALAAVAVVGWALLGPLRQEEGRGWPARAPGSVRALPR